MSGKIDTSISQNFEVAKVAAILTVVAGHFFGGVFWVIVTIGLFVFSFSSGYFTRLKYNGDYDRLSFWKNKGKRLGIRLAVINTFLLFLFLIQSRPGIWNWYTVIDMLGLNGILNWLRIRDPSPFGDGGWFLTLLFIFYLTYPLIERLTRKKNFAYIFAIFCLFLSGYLNHTVYFGYSLWMTAFGFIVGAFFAVHPVEVSKIVSLFIVVCSACLMLIMHYSIGNRSIDYFLVMAVSVGIVLFLCNSTFPIIVSSFSALVSKCLLEIYLIHGYLFISYFSSKAVNFSASLVLIVSAATVLQKASSLMLSRIHSQETVRL